MSLENEVYQTILQVLEWGRMGEMEKFVEAHSQDYTRFSDLPPYTIQHRDLALRLKSSLFTELIDIQFQIREVEIQHYGDIAVATYILDYSGVAVNGYTFEGKKLESSSRCTTVLKRESDRWVIVHEHLSRIQ
jgi:hypothetical protein